MYIVKNLQRWDDIIVETTVMVLWDYKANKSNYINKINQNIIFNQTFHKAIFIGFKL